MARINPIPIGEAPTEARHELERQLAAHGRLTNMKRTLARSPAALTALMQWYPLYEAVVAFLGSRSTMIFSHAISAQTDCLVCSTYFRRWLIEQGDDPDALVLDAREQLLVEYGRQLAIDPHQVADALFERLAAWLAPDQIVTLTAFGSLMFATNLFNNAIRVDLDDYLQAFRKVSIPNNGAVADSASS